MKNSIFNLMFYFIPTIVLMLLIYLIPIDNFICLSVIYIAISLYLIFNYFTKNNFSVKEYIYLFWMLLTLMLNILFVSLINVIISIIILIIVVIQFIHNLKSKEESKLITEIKKEPITIINTKLPNDFDVENFERQIKQIYINMQTYFMNFDYDNLKNILTEDMYNQFESQMKHLEKGNKRAIRENIEFIDFKINDYINNSGFTKVTISIGVYEDKYTKYTDNPNLGKRVSYENYYELVLENSDRWIIQNLKLLYSHSKRE